MFPVYPLHPLSKKPARTWGWLLFFPPEACVLIPRESDPGNPKMAAGNEKRLAPRGWAVEHKTVGFGELVGKHALGQDIATDEGMPMHSSLECT